MRSFVIDSFKAVAAQLIVLHHLATYGPVAAAFGRAVPGVSHWLFDYARMAVQVFIVIGGYLAARSLAAGPDKGGLPSALSKRYLRLAMPFVVALLLTTVVASLLRPWFHDAALPVRPTFPQALAHIFLLHGVLDFQSLSAGAWYVAIDFQLYVLFAGLVWSGRCAPRWHLGFVITLMLTSLFYFNRHSDFDNWALYFFGAYGMGVLAFHISRKANPWPWLGMLLALAVAALWVDFRGRILLASAVAIVLVLARNFKIERNTWLARSVAYLGLNSYALFLVHFTFCLLGNALFGYMGWYSSAAGVTMLALIWLSSNVFADYFYRHIELRAGRIALSPRLPQLQLSQRLLALVK